MMHRLSSGFIAGLCLFMALTFLLCETGDSTKTNSVRKNDATTHERHHGHIKRKLETSKRETAPTSPLRSIVETDFTWILQNLSQEVKLLKREINGMRRHIQKVYMWQKQIQECTEEKKAVQTAGCPEHFSVKRHDSCYLMETEPINWKAASERCQALGAQLVSIESKGEQDFLMDHFTKVQALKLCDFWTGGTDHKTEGKWMWYGTGHPLHYTHWFHSEPNGGRQGEDCLLLEWYFRWRWNDVSCSRKKACYICEHSLK